MARKKRCESIKTTQSKTKERDKGEKNKDGVNKSFSSVALHRGDRCSCTFCCGFTSFYWAIRNFLSLVSTRGAKHVTYVSFIICYRTVM